MLSPRRHFRTISRPALIPVIEVSADATSTPRIHPRSASSVHSESNLPPTALTSESSSQMYDESYDTRNVQNFLASGLLLPSGVPPLIQVQPATPSTPLDQKYENQTSFFSAPNTATPPSPMDASYLPSSPNPPVSSPREISKRPVTMGPRADCEKCRMRVKGHWMHFD